MAVSLSTILHLLASPPSLYPSTTLLPLKTAAISSKLSFASSLHLKHCHSPKPLRFSTAKSATISTTIAVGNKLTLSYLNSPDDVQTVTISDLTKGKKVVLFVVPGAFTSTCSQKHLPGFVEKSAELRSKGVDTIAYISVNDAFVLKAWKEDLKIGDEVLILSDGNGDFTRAIGAELDLSDKLVGLGVRSRRSADDILRGWTKTEDQRPKQHMGKRKERIYQRNCRWVRVRRIVNRATWKQQMGEEGGRSRMVGALCSSK
ncbi:hypothetical protein TIFTF001_015398 [Ficus carica]|uniref:Glutaredoxin-dependent peroxiredoxin n=1 Tax=Ficus carica TaxID=3494 RepID=A0AA88D7U6_FICCA|nr:hypothetical protein TIFTF001_015398 [Ficus carica]